MKTRDKAITNGKKILGNQDFMVYQFPAGHWGYCSMNSPVGSALQNSGMIYPELNCAAVRWEVVNAR